MSQNNNRNSQSNKRKSMLVMIPALIIAAALIIGLAMRLYNRFQDAGNYAGTPTIEATTIEALANETTYSVDVNSTDAIPVNSEEGTNETATTQTITYTFRNQKLLNNHYEKHGIEMGFASAAEYEAAASAVVNHPDALHKIEAEDGDDVYYLEATNEFVIVSTDGYIRTYFNPNDGIDYFNRQ